MSPHIDRTAAYRLQDSVLESRLGDETVLLHIERGTYFGIDSIGTWLWDRLKAGNTVNNLVAATREEFSNGPETVEDDVLDFIRQLLVNDLIEKC